MIPNRVREEFAPELAPVIIDLYNRSLVEGYVPDLLKGSIVNPLPKVFPPQEIKSDLRPIAPTCTIVKVMKDSQGADLLYKFLRTLIPANMPGKVILLSTS